jgi:hypothetical protein
VRNYIREKVENSPTLFRIKNIDVFEEDPLSPHLQVDTLLKMIEKAVPQCFYQGIKAIRIGNYEEFERRDANAFYRNGELFISNKQDNYPDVIDDIVHEIAHHVEILYPEEIYSDTTLVSEFLRKRMQLEFELKSEGYWTNEYDFRNMKYSKSFDEFLYKRVGKNMLAMTTTGLFIRPYASISMREYFATGFEAYYLGKQDDLMKISPALYEKISDLQNDHHK